MKITFTCKEPGELDTFVAGLLDFCGSSRVIAFYGEMGSGKTTFIKAICNKLGVAENVSSPTFSLVNEYFDAGGNKIFHFDFYRIKSLQEVYDLGYEEYFFSGSFCFVEWPEKILNLLPQETVAVTITVEDGIRKISASHA